MNKLQKIGASISMGVGLLAIGISNAKADADFDAAIASTTAGHTEIVPTILTYIADTGLKALIVGVIITLVYFGIRMIRGSISGGKRRR